MTDMSPFSETSEPFAREQSPAQSLQEKAGEAIRTGKQYVRENPVPLLVGAFVLGVVVGALIPREEKSRPGTKEWLEDVYSQLAEKLPKAKKHLPFGLGATEEPSILDQVQNLYKTYKRW